MNKEVVYFISISINYKLVKNSTMAKNAYRLIPIYQPPLHLLVHIIGINELLLAQRQIILYILFLYQSSLLSDNTMIIKYNTTPSAVHKFNQILPTWK